MTSSSFLADNWYWMVAAAASGGTLIWQQVQTASASGLSPNAAVQWINKDKAVVIDVCAAEEFAAGHINGAKNLQVADLGSTKGLPTNKKHAVLVVCASGTRSGKAVAALKKLGYENVEQLAGGLKAWREANLPVSKS